MKKKETNYTKVQIQIPGLFGKIKVWKHKASVLSLQGSNILSSTSSTVLWTQTGVCHLPSTVLETFGAICIACLVML